MEHWGGKEGVLGREHSTHKGLEQGRAWWCEMQWLRMAEHEERGRGPGDEAGEGKGARSPRAT